MMITGMEIRHHEFSKAFRGYDQRQVVEFIDQVALDYENLYSENAQLKETIQRHLLELDKYRKLEATMNNSLILAQQTAEEVKSNARQEASRILEDAKRSIADMMTAYQELVKQINVFNLELKAQLQVELELLEQHLKKNQDLGDFFTKPDIQELLSRLSTMGLEAAE